MTVLVLSEDYDLTVDRVVSELDQRGVPVFRADTAWFPAKLSVTAMTRQGQWSGILRTQHRKVELAKVRSVWYRRPTGFTFPPELSRPERQHATWEARLGLGGVLASLPALFVNHPAREADASYKPWQLKVAYQCGLPVPDTLITNDPAAVLSFADQCHNNIVTKVLGANLVCEEGTAKIIYTRRLDVDDLADLKGVQTTAHLFQHWVDKSHEVRLTAVGQRLFAAAIEATTEAGYVDWRADIAGHRLHPIDIPPLIANGVRDYMATFGLNFGAFDFAVTRRGQWIFLECNAGGQFGFVEAATGQPITAALTDLLEKGSP